MALLDHFFSITCVLLLLFTILSSADYDGGFNPTTSYPEEKPKPEEESSVLSTTIGIQGMVYCKPGRTKPVPLEGAVVRITCLAVDKYGFETAPFSFLSDATDEKGYFFATLCPSEVSANKKIVKECRAFLELSPSESCEVPTDVNRGISGAELASHHLLEGKKMKLFTVGPFYYTSEPPPTSSDNGGY